MGITNGENSNERERIIGLRNAHDQTFTAEMAAGDSVFVCDNLLFSGEIKVGRKHTIGAKDDLPSLMDDCVGYLGAVWDNQTERVEAYKERPLSKEEAHDLVCKAFRAGALPTSKIATVLDEYEGNIELENGRGFRHPDFEERNMWSFLNAYTETAKIWGSETLQRRSIKMVGMLDKYAGHKSIKPLRSGDTFDAEHGEVVVVNN